MAAMPATLLGKRGSFVAIAALVYATVATLYFLYGGLPRHRAETAWFIAAAITLSTLGINRMLRHRATPSLMEVDSDGNRISNRLFVRLNNTTACALLTFASLALYAPILGTGFFSDDFVLLRQTTSSWLMMPNEFFRPLPLFVWWLGNDFWSTHPVALHALNIFVHGINSWLVYLIASELRFGRGWSLLSAALFLANPLSVETVTWISALFDLLMVSGTLAYVLACLRHNHAAALVALFVALASKETGIVACVLGLGMAAISRRRLQVPLMGVLITAAFVAVRIVLLPPPAEYVVAPSRYLLKELLSRPFGALALPWTPSDVTAQALLTLWPWLALAYLAAVAVLFAHPRVSFSRVLLLLSWVPISILPLYRYLYIAPNLENARYMYLGAAAFSLLLNDLAARAPAGIARHLAVALLVASLASGALGVTIHQQPWIAAAIRRDAVLDAARETLAGSRCASISLGGIPDSVDGAYVFRNGFSQALELHRIAIPPVRDTGAECTYVWTGTGFDRP